MSKSKPQRKPREKSHAQGDGQESAPEGPSATATADTPTPAAISESKTTRRIPAKTHFHGGLEGTLDTTALLLMQAAVMAAVATLIIAGVAGILPALLQVIGAWLCRLLLCALAEHLRLQKKAQGLPYDGQISAAREEITYACSECGAPLYSTTRCDSCGRTIEEEGAGD